MNQTMASRRKQANPKSLKLAIDMLIEEQAKHMSSSSSHTTTEMSICKEEFLNSCSFLKNMTNNQLLNMVDESKSMHIQKMASIVTAAEVSSSGCEPVANDEIDVENFSADENSNSNNLRKLDNNTANESIKSRSTSMSSSRSSSVSKHSSSNTPNQDHITEPEEDDDENYENNLGDDEVAVNQTMDSKNKSVRRKRFQSTYTNSIQKQGANSIMINGKRYYQLKFQCENCGLRYSNQNTLNMHMLNYCTKKPIQSTSASTSSSSLSLDTSAKAMTSPKRSNSRSRSVSKSNSRSSSSSSSPSRSKAASIASACEAQTTETTEISNETDNKLAKISANFPTADLVNITNNNDTNIQLLKRVLYQCNNCLFQTDKKSIMNKHSRVHLPQKRKAMEELSLSNNNANDINNSSALSPSLPTQQAKPCQLSPNVDADSIKKATDTSETAYCKDCDIQFSSMKTYQHHRNNYCQKYKTIEAIVPVELTKEEPIVNNFNNTNKKTEMQNEQTNDMVKIKHTPLPLPIKPAQLPSSELPQAPISAINHPNAVSIGDMVYLPAYKLPKNMNSDQGMTPQLMNSQVGFHLNSQKRKVSAENMFDFKPNNQQVETDEIRARIESLIKLSNIKKNDNDNDDNDEEDNDAPLDLSKKRHDDMVKNEMMKDPNNSSNQLMMILNALENNSSKFPYSLSLNESNQMNKKFKANEHMPQNMQQHIDKQNFLNAAYLIKQHQNQIFNKNLQIYNQQQHKQQVMSSPQLHILHPSPNLQLQPTLQLNQSTSSLQPSPAVSIIQQQNELYKCNYCQQIFLKLKEFNRHRCMFMIQNFMRSSNYFDQKGEIITNNNQSIPSSQFNYEKKTLNSENFNKNASQITSRSSSTSSSSSTTSVPAKINQTQTHLHSVQRNQFVQNNIKELIDSLKHPLVKKTLLETYSVNSLEQLIQNLNELKDVESSMSSNEAFEKMNSTNSFFICTACGYRGNTSRGVKQHGKLHLNQREHFGIINATEKYPLVIYNSQSDTDLKINKKKQATTGSLALITSSNKQIDNSYNSEENVSSTDDESNHMNEESNVNNQMDSKSANKKSHESMMFSSIQKSDTYCFKCNIQFQQVKNYLAHKNLYCKD